MMMNQLTRRGKKYEKKRKSSAAGARVNQIRRELRTIVHAVSSHAVDFLILATSSADDSKRKDKKKRSMIAYL